LDDGLDDDSLEEEDSGEELGDGEDEEDEWDTGDEDESAWDDEDYLNSDEESEEESMGEETGDVEGDELEPDNTPFDENAPDDELEGLDGLSDPGGADDLLGNDNPDDLDENSDESEIDERIERLKNERNPSVDEETKIDWELVKVLQSIKSRLARNKNKGDIQDDTATFRKDIKFNKDIYNNINIDLTMLDDYEANISLQDIVDLQRSNEEKDALLMESNLALKELLDFCQYLKEENEEEHLRGEMIAHITNIDNSVDVNLLRSFDLEQLVGFYKYMAEGRDESQDQQDLSEKTEGSVDLQQQQTQTVSRDIPPAPIHQGRHQISLSSSTIQIDNQAYDEALKIFGEVGPRKDNPQGGY
jgi:hypothetical protein